MPERMCRARVALPSTFEKWLKLAAKRLTFEDGLSAGAPVNSSALWASFSRCADRSLLQILQKPLHSGADPVLAAFPLVNGRRSRS